jgi:acyl-CoA thioesterase FadM
MAKIHTRTFRVRWSELDSSGTFSPENFLRYLIETAYDWGDSLGLGSVAYEEMGIYWLIRQTEMTIYKTPVHNDVVDLTIWMLSWQKVRGTRCFEIKFSNTGEIIAHGIQKIVSMDRATNRPTVLADEFIDSFKLENPIKFEESGISFSSSSKPFFTCAKTVELHDLDAQQHVNNAVYFSYAREALAKALSSQGVPVQSLSPAFLQIQYTSPAVWGEELKLDVINEQPAVTPAVYHIKMVRKIDGAFVSDCVIRLRD